MKNLLCSGYILLNLQKEVISKWELIKQINMKY